MSTADTNDDAGEVTELDEHARDGELVAGTAPQGDGVDRVVAVHYHLFKNAGTSLDSAFQEALGEGEWVTREFGGPPHARRDGLAAWIASEPAARCFSSHTSLLPVASIPGVHAVPVIFLRHPLDRIASAYTFESRQGADSFGSVLARNTSLAGYVETRLSIPADSQCREFHAQRLAGNYLPGEGDLRARALRALDELPFVGLVESYGDSLRRLENVLGASGFGRIELKNRTKNTSRGRPKSLEEKLDDMRDKLGDALYTELERANAVDLELHGLLCERMRADDAPLAGAA